jgi:Cu/Ag efflux pump CusA
MPPVVMTAVTTAIVILPVILFGDISGQEILEPMAWVVVGGLITSTLVSLFVLPALYLRFAPRQEPEPLDFGTDHDQAAPELVTASAGVS